MATGKKIAVSHGALEAVKAARKYDPAAPSPEVMKATSGVEVAGAEQYTAKIAEFGYKFGKVFEIYLKQMVQKDFDDAVASIEDLQSLEAEVVRTLRGLESDVKGKPDQKGRTR